MTENTYPTIKLKGKDYLEVKYRIAWFRKDHPTWSIQTEFIKLEENISICKATILAENNMILSTSHKSETPAGFGDYIEKSETGAVSH